MKKRADLLLVERGLAPSRQKAQSMIMAGQVLADDTPVEKAGQLLPEEIALRLRDSVTGYVSRGALKLLQALEEFSIQCTGKSALDIGASTGGFTQVLLEKGAKQVFAIDVGTNQMDWKMRTDPRVHLHEKTNARYLSFELIGQSVEVITMDVSFISITKIIPALLPFARTDTDWVTLIKPQFEVGKEKVGKGGIVSSEEARLEAVQFVKSELEKQGLKLLSVVECKTHGTDGNREYLAHWRLEAE